MFKKLAFVAAIFAALAFASPAEAQSSSCRATTAAPTYAANSLSPLSCDLSGTLRTSTAGGGGGGTSSNFSAAFPTAGTAVGASDGVNMVPIHVDVGGNLKVVFSNSTLAVTGPLTDTQLRAAPVPVSGTVTATGPLTDTQLRATPVPISGSLSANQSTNEAQINGVTPLMGNGVTGTGSQRVTIASDNTAFSVNAVQSGTWTVQPGNTANSTAWLVNDQPDTSGGLTNFVLEPAASDNHATIKSSAGQVYHISVFNNSATINYLRLYNAGAGFNGCNSATNLVWETNIPASTAGAGFVEDISGGIAFATGISICVTGAYGQTSTTAATASAMSVNIGYK